MIPADIKFPIQDTNVLTTPEVVKNKLVIRRNISIIIVTVTAIALTALVAVGAVVLHIFGATYIPLLVTGFGILLPILYKLIFEKYVKQIIATSDAILIEKQVIKKQEEALINEDIDTSNNNYMYEIRVEVLKVEIESLTERIEKSKDTKISPFKLIAKKVKHYVEASFCNHLKSCAEEEKTTFLSSRVTFPALKYTSHQRELALLDRLPMFIKDEEEIYWKDLDDNYMPTAELTWQ